MNAQRMKEIRTGVLQGAGVAAVVLAVAGIAVWLVPAAPPVSALPRTAPPPLEAKPRVPQRIDFGGADAPADVRAVAGWALASNDTRGAPFALVDKRRTHLWIFDGQGRLRGHAPVLLGYATGDDSVPGIGQRPIEQVRPAERTTPAGRFEATVGRNLLDEEVIWVDYGAAVSMHRVRATDPRERRLQRLASPTTADNRISYGCINVPVAFFEGVVWPALGGTVGTRPRALVYVLPEAKPLGDVFPRAAAWAAAAV